MNTRDLFLSLSFTAAALGAQPVESEMDKPLDLSKRWSFYSDETVYLQHQCSAPRARAIAALAQKFLRRAEVHLERRELVLPLQLRIYAGADQYRRTLRFSRHREAHYNPRLAIVTAHCGVSATVLEEQLALFWLADAGLRTWQRFLLAESLSRMEQVDRYRPATGKSSKKRVPLAQILLSDHPLEADEVKTLAGFLAQLAARGRMKDFVTGLYHDRETDGTGLDTLDALFPGISGDILSNREPDFSRYKSP
ncbi:MAG: hypothetical protein ACOY5B_04180 [Spirochaetota bacterium]